MNRLLLVAAGGAVGASARYAVSGAVTAFGGIPAGTLVVNVLGSFLLGLVMYDSVYLGALGPETRVLFGVGVLGAFTTFSTFSYESFALLEEGDAALFAGNVLLNVAACLAAVFLARSVAMAASGVAGP